MASDIAPHVPEKRLPPTRYETTPLWQEELNRALTGFEPTDQVLEKIIDWVERKR